MKYVLLLIVLSVSYAYAEKVRVYPASEAAIAKAVRKAQPGDKLVITNGVYHETEVLIDKPLEIIAEGKVTIQSAKEGNLFIVRAHNVIIEGLTLMAVKQSFISDFAAIKIENAEYIKIADNTFVNNFFGIHASRMQWSFIINNRFQGTNRSEANSGNAIHLWNCRNIQVTGNKIQGHRDGIYLEFCRTILVQQNASWHNLRYGLHFMFSDSCYYAGNSFSNNGAGVAVMYSQSITMQNNNFLDNLGASSYGLLLKDIKNGTVEKNIFKGNTTGILLDGAVRIHCSGNTFNSNGWAVRLMANSEDNSFTGNNFLNNTFAIATNTRDNRAYFSGNYWDEYSGYDINKDGIGDTPHYPVSLFSIAIEKNPVLIVLIRSFFVNVLNAAERIAPALTPKNLYDAVPKMKVIHD